MAFVRTVGSPVSGNDRFFGRDLELARLGELLDEGAHVLLAAPRRTGKTSLMKEIALRKRDVWICLECDVQAAVSAEDVISRLVTAAWQHMGTRGKVRSVFERLLGHVEHIGVDELSMKLRDDLAGNWQAKGARMLADLATLDKPVVIMMDELPIFVHRLLTDGDDHGEITPTGRSAATLFLSWLREMALAHTGRVRFVVAGSIGLESVLALARISATTNHLTTLAVPPWSRAEAVGCIKRLAQSYRLDLNDDVAGYAVDKLGVGIPHHVQLLFDQLRDDALRRGSAAVHRDDVDRVYTSQALSSAGHRDLVHYEERLLKVLPRDQVPLALDLLTAAAVEGTLGPERAAQLAERHAPGPQGSADTLRHLRTLFLHDGYLIEVGPSLRFASLLLRDWWARRFGTGWESAR